MSRDLQMRVKKRRFQYRIDHELAAEMERLASARSMCVSDMTAYLVGRGLELEGHLELVRLTRLMEAQGEQIDQLQAQIEALETREAERFRRFLGHLQHHQALTTELVCGQRVKMAGDRPRDYEKTIETARGQVTEDAVVFRESIALVGPVRRSDNATKSPGRVP